MFNSINEGGLYNEINPNHKWQYYPEAPMRGSVFGRDAKRELTEQLLAAQVSHRVVTKKRRMPCTINDVECHSLCWARMKQCMRTYIMTSSVCWAHMKNTIFHSFISYHINGDVAMNVIIHMLTDTSSTTV